MCSELSNGLIDSFEAFKGELTSVNKRVFDRKPVLS